MLRERNLADLLNKLEAARILARARSGRRIYFPSLLRLVNKSHLNLPRRYGFATIRKFSPIFFALLLIALLVYLWALLTNVQKMVESRAYSHRRPLIEESDHHREPRPPFLSSRRIRNGKNEEVNVKKRFLQLPPPL